MALLAGAVLVIGISTIYPIGSGGPSAAYAAAQTFTEVDKIPIDVTVTVPCAAGGAGEEVYLTGEEHIVYHITLDGAGGAHVKFQENLQRVSGTGLTTGDIYRATGAYTEEFNVKVGVEVTLLGNIHFIGQGNGNNLLLHEIFHVTIHPDGTATSLVDNFSIECK
jgi:hypothetical protein